MAYNPDIHHRRSIRLIGYDYSQAGLYFITICAQNRACRFGNIPVGAPLVGAQSGMITGWPQGHAPTGAQFDMPQKSVGDMVDAFKSITTVNYIHGLKTMGWEPFNGKLWQRNYHDHIIRNEQSYQIISDYIIENPAKWANDKLFSL